MPEEEGYTTKDASSAIPLGANLDANHLISATPHDGHESLLGRVEVEPRGQLRLSLGNYTADTPPKGFSIEFTPDPDPPESAVSQIISVGTTEEYELIVNIANYGSKNLDANIWRL
jgi:hypothetical protein